MPLPSHYCTPIRFSSVYIQLQERSGWQSLQGAQMKSKGQDFGRGRVAPAMQTNAHDWFLDSSLFSLLEPEYFKPLFSFLIITISPFFLESLQPDWSREKPFSSLTHTGRLIVYLKQVKGFGSWAFWPWGTHLITSWSIGCVTSFQGGTCRQTGVVALRSCRGWQLNGLAQGSVTCVLRSSHSLDSCPLLWKGVLF